ncbi:hypothetical protein CPB83DRAFT_246157 [Crepidotus variabilis]|uniref:Uncharacterized protein n=1 Tax=Crepidotus variabilis TaxID=179855 RepID=A0A9P6E2Y3_9AGAR|nr:hypothetical protein CPB83DRAFT_246157 [Crepidotus variabilis]
MGIYPNCRLPGSATLKNPSDIIERSRARGSPCQACQGLLEVELKTDEARRNLQLLFGEKEKLASVLNEHHDPPSFIHNYCRLYS